GEFQMPTGPATAQICAVDTVPVGISFALAGTVSGDTAAPGAEAGISARRGELGAAVITRSGQALFRLLRRAVQAPRVPRGVDPLGLKQAVQPGLSASRAPAVGDDSSRILTTSPAPQRAIGLHAGGADVERPSALGAVEQGSGLPDLRLVD